MKIYNLQGVEEPLFGEPQFKGLRPLSDDFPDRAEDRSEKRNQGSQES